MSREEPQYPYELFGNEVGNGWKKITRKAIKAIEEIHKRYLENPPKSFNPDGMDITFEQWYGKSNIAQVKQKYGELRIYTNYRTDQIEEIIRVAEEDCSKTCEICGVNEDDDNTVKIRGDYWIFNNCESCWNKNNSQIDPPICEKTDE